MAALFFFIMNFDACWVMSAGTHDFVLSDEITVK